MSSVFSKSRAFTNLLLPRFQRSVCKTIEKQSSQGDGDSCGQFRHQQLRNRSTGSGSGSGSGSQHEDQFMPVKAYEKKTKRLHVTKRDDVGILGVPLNMGQGNAGVMYGADVIREAGLITRLSEMGRPIVDHGDITYEVDPEDENEKDVGYIRYPRTLGNALKSVSDSVYSIVAEHQQTCVVLGGDHSLSIGSLHGHARAEPNMCVIWIDAHADLNLPQTSPSRNLHGMVLSFVCKETQKYLPKIPGFEWCTPCIDANSIAYIGLRDIDPAESYILDNYGMKCFDIHQIDKYGIAEIFSRAMEFVNPRGDRPIHLSFDIDSLDPIISASTGTPVWGGLTYREGMFIAEEVSRSNLMSVVDLVEVNPQLGTPAEQESTTKAAVDVLMAAIGKRREGNTPPDFKIPDP